MTAKQLKTLLHAVPDDALVVIPGSDHSYSTASVEAITAVSYDRGSYICEDHGTHNDAGGKIIPVLLVS